MEKIFGAIATQLGVDKNNLRFTFDGKRVQAGMQHIYQCRNCSSSLASSYDVHHFCTKLENTPKMLEMEDEDQIDCMIEQVGGTNPLEQLSALF